MSLVLIAQGVVAHGAFILFLVESEIGEIHIKIDFVKLLDLLGKLVFLYGLDQVLVGRTRALVQLLLPLVLNTVEEIESLIDLVWEWGLIIGILEALVIICDISWPIKLWFWQVVEHKALPVRLNTVINIKLI